MKKRSIDLSLLALLVSSAVSLSAGPCPAAIIFVDNRHGDDSLNGETEKLIDFATGPVRSIGRALRIARNADTVVLANTGKPYYESLQLAGTRHSGLHNVNFTIAGNGAVISGARPVPAKAWKRVGPTLWRMTPWRKAHYQLLLDDKPVPEHKVKPGTKTLPEIPAGHWTGWRGSMYYSAKNVSEDPGDLPLWFAYHGVGLTLHDVHDVQIIDVTFKHFRLDGINAHDRCRRILLDNVTLIENGRAGLAVGGTSKTMSRNCKFTGNRIDSVLISEKGLAEIDKSELSQPPTLRD